MTEAELMKAFKKEFGCDCYSPLCEGYDCCECEVFSEAFENYKEENENA